MLSEFLRHMRAILTGGFWLPCRVCGRMFGPADMAEDVVCNDDGVMRHRLDSVIKAGEHERHWLVCNHHKGAVEQAPCWDEGLDPLTTDYWLAYEARYNQGMEQMQQAAQTQFDHAAHLRRAGLNADLMGYAMLKASVKIKENAND